MSRRIGKLLLPYLVLVSIHLLSGLQREQPIIMADELGYLGNARYLSGTAHLPDMQNRRFYHFGYSLALFPAFWLFTEPVSVYKAAIIINALLVASLYFPLYFIITSFFQVPERTAGWIAFAGCLYPPLILYSNFAWSENAYIPFYALATALFAKYLASKSPRDALLFSLVAGFLYTIHPRALPVLAAILVYFLVLALLKAISIRHLFLSLSTMASVFVVTRIVNQHLKATGWAGGGEVSATKLAGRLLPSADFPALMERAAGQVLYLSLATHGLFLLGIIAMIGLILKYRASGSTRQVLANPVTGVALFILITASGVFAAACALKLYSLHGPAGVRGEEFIHGRYNEALAVFTIVFALVEYLRNGFRTRQVVWRVIAVTATILCLNAVVMLEINDALKRQVADMPGVQPREEIPASEVKAIAIPGVYPLVGMTGALNLYPISFAVIASFMIITAMMRVSRRGGVAVLLFLFTFFSYYNYRHYLRPHMARGKPRLTFVSQMGRFGPIPAISYDTAHRDRGFLARIQYLMPHTVFDRFDSSEGEEPPSEAVVSGNNWPQAQRLGARFVVSSDGHSALWFLPGTMQSRLPFPAYEGVTLGATRAYELQETGFHGPEQFEGVPGRWTNGAASLRVPLNPRNRPQRLGIETVVPGRDGARFQVLANGVELWNQWIPGDVWSKVFSLEQIPLKDALLIELKSDTFSPAESLPGSTDKRRLGVMVRGIRLSARESFDVRNGTRNEME